MGKYKTGKPEAKYEPVPHIWFKHEGEECDKPGHCPFCDGGLALCTVCGAVEAELPKECPGRKLTPIEKRAIQDGLADYNNGVWWWKGRDDF